MVYSIPAPSSRIEAIKAQSNKSAAHGLEAEAAAQPSNETIRSLKELFAQRLYHEFTIATYEHFAQIDAALSKRFLAAFPLASDTCALDQDPAVYDAVRFLWTAVVPARQKLDAFSFAELAALTSLRLPTSDAIWMLNEIEHLGWAADRASAEACMLIRATKASHMCVIGEWKAAMSVLEEVTDDIDSRGFAEVALHAAVQRGLAAVAKKSKDLCAFHQHGMLVFAYTRMDVIDPEAAKKIAFDVTTALLLSESNFDVGEVLYHPAKCFRFGECESTKWLAETLNAFRGMDWKELSGNWEQVERAISDKNCTFTEEEKDVLLTKMRLINLLELAFRTSGRSKTIALADIAKHCRVPVEETELLLMRGMCNDIVQGRIDQPNQVFLLTSVKSRILSTERLEALATMLDAWSVKVKVLSEEMKEAIASNQAVV